MSTQDVDRGTAISEPRAGKHGECLPVVDIEDLFGEPTAPSILGKSLASRVVADFNRMLGTIHSEGSAQDYAGHFKVAFNLPLKVGQAVFWQSQQWDQFYEAFHTYTQGEVGEERYAGGDQNPSYRFEIIDGRPQLQVFFWAFSREPSAMLPIHRDFETSGEALIYVRRQFPMGSSMNHCRSIPERENCTYRVERCTRGMSNPKYISIKIYAIDKATGRIVDCMEYLNMDQDFGDDSGTLITARVFFERNQVIFPGYKERDPSVDELRSGAAQDVEKTLGS